MKTLTAIISHLRGKRTRSSCFKWSLGLKSSAFVHRGGACYPAHVWKPKLGIHRSFSSLPQEKPPLLEAEKSSPVILLAAHRLPTGGSPHAALTRWCWCVQVSICHCDTSATHWTALGALSAGDMAGCGTGSHTVLSCTAPLPTLHCPQAPFWQTPA